MSARGAVACGHPVTRDAATAMLEAGGNAFDAAAAGLWAACVAEPVLASPGGGGYLLADPASGPARVFDFFAHTPRRRLPFDDSDFRPIVADFGTTQQEFHIGLGAAATPGTVAGVFAFQRELGRMPAGKVVEPAVTAAREGVTVNALQAYIAQVVAPILSATPEARSLFTPQDRPAREGDIHRVPELADCLETLAIEGPELFYAGEIAGAIDGACRAGGGHLRREDLENYQVIQREPLTLDYRGHRVKTNAPPASGGVLVAFALSVMAGIEPGADSLGPEEALRTARALHAATEARSEAALDVGVDEVAAARLLDPATVSAYRARLAGHPPAYRGTTHISVADAAGNTAALTTSNGEGCGWIVPDTGFMLNNVLGEADLQPRGFGQWPEDVRLTSMMAPTLLQSPEGTTVAVGSGGSNRIRSAITQVLAGQVDHGLDLAAALERPRLHVEGERLEIEGGFPAETVAALAEQWPDHCAWPERNLFFGGAHGVSAGAGRFDGAGDPRRGGVAAIV